MTCMFTLILTNKCVNQRSMTVILRSKHLQHKVIVVICEKVTNTSGLGLKQLVFPKVLFKFPLSHNRFSLLVSKYGGFFGGVTILDLNLQTTHSCLANKKLVHAKPGHCPALCADDIVCFVHFEHKLQGEEASIKQTFRKCLRPSDSWVLPSK